MPTVRLFYSHQGYADVVQIEASLAEKEYRYTDVANMRADAYITLKDMMFYPVDRPLAVDISISDDTLDHTAPANDLSQSEQSEHIVGIAMTADPSIAIARGEMTNARICLLRCLTN